MARTNCWYGWVVATTEPNGKNGEGNFRNIMNIICVEGNGRRPGVFVCRPTGAGGPMFGGWLRPALSVTGTVVAGRCS